MRRAAIFVVFAAACFLLLPASEPQFRWVCNVTGATYLVLAAASALDARSRAKQ